MGEIIFEDLNNRALWKGITWLAGGDGWRAKQTKRLQVYLETFSELLSDDGIQLVMMSFSDAVYTYNMAMDAEMEADAVISDPNASVEALTLAFRVKAAANNVKAILTTRPDFKDVRATAEKLRDSIWKEHISPIIERRDTEERR